MYEEQYEDLYIIAQQCDRKNERVKIISEEAFIFRHEFSCRCNFNSLFWTLCSQKAKDPLISLYLGNFRLDPLLFSIVSTLLTQRILRASTGSQAAQGTLQKFIKHRFIKTLGIPLCGLLRCFARTLGLIEVAGMYISFLSEVVAQI